MRRLSVLLALLCLLSPAVLAKKDAAADKKSNSSRIVDEGTFAVFQNGRQVATENFSIRQMPASSITESEVRLDTGQPNGILKQSSKLTLMPDGSLLRYEYNQESPKQGHLTVEPGDHFLQMRGEVDGKKIDQPFFLAASAFVLDDYFFAPREVLLWEYLASSCKPPSAGGMCKFVQLRFPTLIPERATSSQVFIDFKGYEDAPMNGRPQHLRHFVMRSDGPEWHLWLNADQKLLRISIPDTGIEVLRQSK
jgi:hypothetical protein